MNKLALYILSNDNETTTILVHISVNMTWDFSRLATNTNIIYTLEETSSLIWNVK